ncbi:flagellar protein FliT [Planococcus beijingensis]|uniref:flagellar protein FliT n=1 Tax=Planococcus beijingensis TaxID=2782551 RepID=UPI00193C3DF8|nr:flagellar protein FliT [Planococcus beijingensis]MBF6634454.1 flagellar protein FliT [Planococcus sp. (in: firmicutes)]
MNSAKSIMHAFLKQTQELYERAQTIHSRMEANEEGTVEALETLFFRRQESIKQLETFMRQKNFQWTTEEHFIIEQVKESDQQLQQLLNNLHFAFLTQIKRIAQTKEVSKKYNGAYQTMATGGSFIDKRN